MRRPDRLFWPLASVLVLADCTTKRIVEAGQEEHVPHTVIDGVLRFTLAYNPGAAFSSRFGPYQRWLLVALTLAILVFLARLYRATAHRGRLYVVAIALVCGGAVGNLLDRLRSPRGVVDFIDLGLGSARFWVFNVADMGVSVGAALLVLALWRLDRERDEAGSAPAGGTRM
jgi:signal peptidase II